ncbi:HTH-type transcriptional repressor RspR [Moorella humiferrea]
MEAEIAMEINISRTPVREALRKLEQEGLVSYEPGRGVVVTYLSSQDMPEIYCIMIALEGMAARLAAENISDIEIEELEKSLLEMENALARNDLDDFHLAHKNFNQLIFTSTRNRHLCELLKRYNDYIARTERISWVREKEDLKKEHWAILAAIKARDGESAERIMRNHVEHSRQTYLKGIGTK